MLGNWCARYWVLQRRPEGPQCRSQSACWYSHLSNSRLRFTCRWSTMQNGIRSWNSRMPSCHWKKISSAAWRCCSRSWSMIGASLLASKRASCVSKYSTALGVMIESWWCELNWMCAGYWVLQKPIVADGKVQESDITLVHAIKCVTNKPWNHHKLMTRLAGTGLDSVLIQHLLSCYRQKYAWTNT